MNNENLSREEAAERSALISVDTYDVHVDLTNAKDPEFESYPTATTVRFSCNTPGAETFIDYIHHSIDSIKLNGVELKLDEVVDGARIRLANLKAENVLTIHGRSYYSRSGEGLHRYFDPSDGRVYLYTQYEPSDCRRVFPNFEQPDLKAVFNFRITAPKDWVVSSNAVLESQVTDPSDDSISKRVFAPTAKISTYITAILAGEYFTATTTYKPKSKVNSGDIPLVAYCRQSLKPHFDYDHIFKVTENGLDFFQDLFDYPYPYPKYEQAFVPEYNIGAMENPGLVTFTEDYIFVSGATEDDLEGRTNTICHEMAHMWFGDLVTMKWWNDLWLNESFAEFMSTLAAAENTRYAKEAWATFSASEKTWAYRQDQLSSTHPIVAEIRDLADVQVNFDGITYAKGASVLRQMVAWVGQENFMAALKVYFDKHSWGNTVLDDLLVELERTSGRDVRAWSAKWLETAGVNTLAVEVENDEAGNISNLGIRQSYAEGFETLRPHRAVIGFYNLVDGKLTRTDRIELDIDGELTVVEEAVGKKRPDLLLLNDEDLAYAKIRLDERSIETAIKHLGDIDSSVARGVVWGSLWDTVRDAQMPARKYVDLVLNNIGKETNSTALRTQINNLSATLHSFVAPEAREETRHRAADRLWELAKAAEPDSDAQLQLLQAFINQTRTEEQYDNVQRLFEGELTLEGLDIDADLRWNLVCRLATGGRFSAEQIAEELENDNTANGQQYAAQAYASLPTAEAKAEYWNKIMVTGELSNMIQRYAISGFKSGKPELIAQYDEPYFEQIEGIWRSRSHEISMQIIGGMYPSEPTAELLERTEAYLASLPEDAAALYRQIAEARDGVARALKVQAADI